MLQRCGNSKHPKYKDYGGRGIVVCERWKKFENFLADMGRRPSSKRTLERKNNDGPYSLENCVWATKKDQARNRRNNRMVSYQGQSLCLAAVAEKMGVPYHTLQARLNRGMTVDEALHG